MKKILAGIVMYEPGDYIDYVIKNIEILKNNKFVDVLVIENSANEENIKKIKKIFNEKEISYVYNEKKEYPGYAFNQIIMNASNKNYEWCFFIDQDTMINNKTIDALVKVADNDRYSFLASNVVSETDGRVLRYFRGNYNKNMTFHSVNPSTYKKNPVINAGGYTGLLINMKIVQNKQISINENLKIAFDDYDLTLNLSENLPGILVEGSIVSHPNKKTMRNNYLGELFDAYYGLFTLNRQGRDELAVMNYIYLIDRYGSGKLCKFKIKLSKISFLNRFLMMIKRIV